MSVPSIWYANNGLLDIYYIVEGGRKCLNGDGQDTIYIRAFNTTPDTIWTVTGTPGGMAANTFVGLGYCYLTGVPNAPGTYTFTVRAENSDGYDEKSFTLRVGQLGGGNVDAIYDTEVHIYAELESTFFTSWLSQCTALSDTAPNWGFDTDNYTLPPYPFVAPAINNVLASTYPSKCFIIHTVDAALGTYTFPGFLWRPDGTTLNEIPFTIVIHLVHSPTAPPASEITIAVRDTLTFIDSIFIGDVQVEDTMLMLDKVLLNITYGTTPSEEVFDRVEGDYYCPPYWVEVVDA